MVGSWNVKVSKDMPQKVATAMGKLNDLFGVEYTPIVYLGTQEVNGINHAVLTEQLVTTGKDTKNIKVVKFNEKPGEIDLVLVGIEDVVASGGDLGGIRVNVETTFSSEVKEMFDNAFNGYVGAKITPIAYLGSQVTKGVDHIFAVEVTPVTLEPVSKASIVVINTMTELINGFDLLTDNTTVKGLGYSFTW